MSGTAQGFHLIFIHLVDSRFAHWDDKAESNDDKKDNEIEDAAGTMKY